MKTRVPSFHLLEVKDTPAPGVAVEKNPPERWIEIYREREETLDVPACSLGWVSDSERDFVYFCSVLR